MNLLLTILTLMVVLWAVLIQQRGQPGRRRLTSPVFLVAAFSFFYGVASNWYREWYGNYWYLGRDFSDIAYLGTLSTLLFFTAYCFAYFTTPQRVSANDYRYHAMRSFGATSKRAFTRLGYSLQAAGYLSVLVWSVVGGRSLALFGAEIELSSGAGGQTSLAFLLLLFNLTIPGIVLCYAAGSRLRFILILVFLAFCVALGFRYRIAIVSLALFALFMLSAKPGMAWRLKLTAASLALVSLFIVVGLSRVYTKGISLDRLAGVESADQIFAGLFSDTNVMLGLAAVIADLSETAQYEFLGPYAYALMMFVPRLVWPDKPEPETFKVIISALGTPDAYTAGTAVPFWGEPFIAFGWLGVVGAALLLGFLTRRMLGILRAGSPNERGLYALPLYSVLYGFLYFVLLRGYLGQIVPEFLVVVGPILVAHLRDMRGHRAVRLENR